ncbi:glycosyltransferase [Siminovitchia sediminis]|uniref:Glycosyltransferase n=1 Tax=Siminovitchia sediminis TaxID=1274353 RepID=A0ABW4KEM3_9BACI
MKNYAVYFMLHSIEQIRGGMTRAAIKRAKMLSESFNDIGLITFDFNPDYDEVIQHYREIGLWDHKIKHYNVYEYFMELPQAKADDHSHMKLFPPNSSIQYDKKGRPRKITYYDEKSGKAVSEQLLTKDGRCFLNRNFEAVSYDWLDPNGNMIRSFKKVRDYRHYFIQSLLNQKNAVLFSDSRFTDRILLGAGARDIQAVRAAVLHSNHLQSPYQYGSSLVQRNKLLFEQLNELDALIVLTETQAAEISSRYGNRTTIHFVGHPGLAPSERKAEHDPYTAVMLARYERIKQIPHAIRAFKRVVKKVPEARLEIWGFGREEKQYIRLIKRLKLQNHVFIKGFANNIEEIYQRAAFSLITSKSEAFGMAIIESMSVGTPVICYDCKYGPTDLIDHGKSGLLIEQGNIKGLADAMEDLFVHQEKRQALSQEAKRVSGQFGEKRLTEKWTAILKEAINQRKQRVHIDVVKAEILDMVFHEESGLKVQGRVQFKDLDQAFRDKVLLFLQLRKRKEMEDVYTPLSVTWEKPGTVLFKGTLANFESFHRGRWDLKLSVSCLNFHQFVHPTSSCLDHTFTLRNRKMKITKEGEHFIMKVYHPKKKIPMNAHSLIEKYKANIRDVIRRASSQ